MNIYMTNRYEDTPDNGRADLCQKFTGYRETEF